MFSERNACHTATGCQPKVVNLILFYYFAITTAVLRCRLQFWNIGTRKSTNSFNRILRHSTQVVLKCFFYDRAFPFSARKRKKSYYHSTKFSIEVYLFLVWFLLNAEQGGGRPCSLHPTMFFFAAQLDKLGPALAEKAAASQTDNAILSNKQNGFIQRSHLCSQTSAYVLN